MWKNAIITRKWVGLKSHNFSRIMFYYNIVKIKPKFKWLNFWSMSPRGRMDQKLFLQSTQLFCKRQIMRLVELTFLCQTLKNTKKLIVF